MDPLTTHPAHLHPLRGYPGTRHPPLSLLARAREIADTILAPRGEGYRFDGAAPWATGWGLATHVLLAGTLPSGDSAWVVIPAEESEALRASPPMRLCAASASATVSLSCRGLVAGPEWFVKTASP